MPRSRFFGCLSNVSYDPGFLICFFATLPSYPPHEQWTVRRKVRFAPVTRCGDIRLCCCFAVALKWPNTNKLVPWTLSPPLLISTGSRTNFEASSESSDVRNQTRSNTAELKHLLVKCDSHISGHLSKLFS